MRGEEIKWEVTYRDFIMSTFENEPRYKRSDPIGGVMKYMWESVPLKLPKNLGSEIPVKWEKEKTEVDKLLEIVDGSPYETGSIVYNEDLKQIEVYNGKQWVAIG